MRVSPLTRRTALSWPLSALLHAREDSSHDWLEIDAHSGEALHSGGAWPSANGIFPGSLVKPFTALAFTGPAYPQVTCKGCWSGKAHGSLDLPSALAVSCNKYFEQLSLRVDHRRMLLVCEEYGIAPPPDSVDARVGLGREWRVAPLDLLRAYCRLSQRGPSLILEGLRRAAASGTAKVLKGGALAKTGTAPCEHAKRMPGDGLAIALWPADGPRRAMLVREHGVPGAIAAKRLRLS